jgi:hypothetical protein
MNGIQIGRSIIGGQVMGGIGGKTNNGTAKFSAKSVFALSPAFGANRFGWSFPEWYQILPKRISLPERPPLLL